jgi:hypothetical protein
MQITTSRIRTWSVAALLIAMVGCGSSNKNPVGVVDTVAPTVSATNPADGATGVAAITATFSEAMNASTISAVTFRVSGPGATPVPGTVAYSATSDMASFTPATALAPGAVYTATITTGVEDVAGNSLVSGHVWSFTTAMPASSGDPPTPGRTL